MQTQTVQSGAGAPTSPQHSRFHPGQLVRLKEGLVGTDVVYVILHRGGKDEQCERQRALTILNEHFVVDVVQRLDNPVPDLASTEAEDCWFKLHFMSGVVLQHDYFSAWQFEPVE